MARVLALSSHVVRGGVGLTATVPALQALGHEVWALPTVTLAARPGLGTAALARWSTAPADLARALAALAADACWPTLDGVVLGYFPDADAVAVAARAVADIRAANPRAFVLVDPILGDAGRLYVSEATAVAIRDQLLPLADIATPNAFELAWLTRGAGAQDLAGIAAAAASLGPPTVVVTSAWSDADRIVTLLVHRGAALEQADARLDALPNGTGDLFDGLLLGNVLRGLAIEAAFRQSLQTLAQVLEKSVGREVLALDRLRPT